jgi:hypothetical protein
MNINTMKATYNKKALNCLELCNNPIAHQKYIKKLGLSNEVYNNPAKYLKDYDNTRQN